MSLLESLARFEAGDPEEEADLARIRGFIVSHSDPFDRAIPEGHLTGSALVVSAEGDRVLLLFHLKLQRWLQPGGHASPGEASGEEVALREAREETGIEGLSLHPLAPRPLDLDIHEIPAHGLTPAHEHLDLRYLVVALKGAQPSRRETEASDVRWFSWEEVSRLDLDPGLLRALRKARALFSSGI